ncbi:Heterokaryon incompatibility, partial [Macrophomina phaseolina MS6]
MARRIATERKAKWTKRDQPSINIETTPRFVDFGPIAEVRKRIACSFCVLINHLLPSDFLLPFEANVVIGLASLPTDANSLEVLILESDGRDGADVCAMVGLRQRIPVGHIEVKWAEPVVPNPEKTLARSLPPMLNFKRIKELLSQCESCHEQTLGGRLNDSGEPPLKILLLDTQRGCLVKATTKYRYLALSYVRGKDPFFHTTTANLLELQKPGGIFRIRSQLPQTLLDAIILTREIGERYLWIDALCIPQDNPSLHHRPSQTGTIFGHSHLTIIAWTAASAHSSLAGVRPCTLRPPHLSKHFPFSTNANRPSPPLLHLRTAPFHADYMRTHHRLSRHTTRAWTYQERLLSPRRLYLSYHDAFFVCAASPASCSAHPFPIGVNTSTILLDDGELALPHPASLVSSSVVPAAPPSPGPHSLLATLIADFAPTTTTRPADRLAAFAGVQALLRPRFGGDDA